MYTCIPSTITIDTMLHISLLDKQTCLTYKSRPFFFAVLSSHKDENKSKVENVTCSSSQVAGERETAVGGEREAAVAGKREAAVADERGAAVAGEREAAVAGERVAAVAGEREAAVTGERKAALAGEWEMAVAVYEGLQREAAKQPRSNIKSVRSSSLEGRDCVTKRQ